MIKNLDSFSHDLIMNAIHVGNTSDDGCPIYQSLSPRPESFKESGFGNAGVNFIQAVDGCDGLFHRWYANGFLNGPRNYEFYIYFGK